MNQTEIAGAVRRCGFRVNAAAQRFVQHDRHLDLTTRLRKRFYLLVRNRLLHRADSEGLKRANVRDHFARRPGLIGVDAQIDAALKQVAPSAKIGKLRISPAEAAALAAKEADAS